MGKILFEMKDLCMNYGSLVISDGISFSIEKGKTIGLMGPNGAGKTTLFDCITGICSPMGGNIIFKNKDITQMTSFNTVKLGIARTFQISGIILNMTVQENVMSGAYLRASNKKEALNTAEKIMDDTGLFDMRNCKGSELNLMCRKKLELARALATKPEMLIADESMAGLGQIETEEFIKLYLNLKNEGLTMLITEHITDAVLRIADRIVAIAYGKKIAEGKPKDVITDIRVINTYLGDNA